MKWIVRVVLFLAALLLLAVGTLGALGMRGDAGVERASIEIARPPEAVWPWLEEPEKVKAWISWLVEVRETAPNKFVWVMEDANNGNQRVQIDAEVTANDPPRRYAVRSSTPGEFEGDASYVLTDLGGGRTRLDVEGRYHYDVWMARLMEPLITHESKKKTVSDIAKLKSLVEAK